MSLERRRVPDYSIGATVLVVAIALPFFIFTRAEHFHKVNSALPPAQLATTQGQAAATPDLTAQPSPSLIPQGLPSKAPPTARPGAKQVTAHPSTVPTNPPTSTPTSTPSPVPDSPPVAKLVVSIITSTPLTVLADASGSSGTDLTPIAQVVFDFGDGTIVTLPSGRTATHTYANPGTYAVAVAVFDTAHLSRTVTTFVTVS